MIRMPTVLATLLLLQFSLCSPNVDLIIFSFHRPMQLYALLESAFKNLTGLGRVSVIWRADAENYAHAYQEVFKQFPIVTSLREEKEQPFKQLVLQTTRKSEQNHIMYAVDDIIVTHPCDLNNAVAEKQKHNAYGFYLRLGKNITSCYTLNIPTGLPPFIHDDNQVIVWQFSAGKGDWAYPNSVDMTIVAKKDMLQFLATNPEFYNPNTFESAWSKQANLDRHGIAYQHSRMVNNPANLVNQVYRHNRTSNLYSPLFLLKVFKQGKKIDINKFQGINNQAPHEDHTFEFVPR